MCVGVRSRASAAARDGRGSTPETSRQDSSSRPPPRYRPLSTFSPRNTTAHSTPKPVIMKVELSAGQRRQMAHQPRIHPPGDARGEGAHHEHRGQRAGVEAGARQFEQGTGQQQQEGDGMHAGGDGQRLHALDGALEQGGGHAGYRGADDGDQQRPAAAAASAPPVRVAPPGRRRRCPAGSRPASARSAFPPSSRPMRRRRTAPRSHTAGPHNRPACTAPTRRTSHGARRRRASASSASSRQCASGQRMRSQRMMQASAMAAMPMRSAASRLGPSSGAAKRVSMNDDPHTADKATSCR